jgi:hypothetical protein
MNVNNLSLASWCDRQRSVDLLAVNGGPARIVELPANNCAGCSPW